MNIAIIQYNAGNVQSVQNALQRLGYTAKLTSDIAIIQSADKVIFPGVGHAGAAMQSLKQTGLHQIIPTLTQPVLGICVGMQLMCSFSEEANTTCLGIVNTNVKKFRNTHGLKVPQVGWNKLYECNSNLFKGIEHAHVYFVNSFYAEIGDECIAKANYPLPFAAAIQKNNFYAVQFHVEKSAAVGDRILNNFLSLK